MSSDIMIKVKRGVAANLSTAGVVAGELKYTTDTQQLHIGNGTENICLSNAFESGATFPVDGAKIRTDKFFVLTASVDEEHPAGVYYWDGTKFVAAGISNYELLSNKPSIAGTEIIGDHVADYYGLVDKTSAQTITGKTMDADDNVFSNFEVDNFKASALSTTIAAAAVAVDTKLTTEKAVRTELDLKFDKDHVVDAFQTTPDDEHVPSELLMKTELDNKVSGVKINGSELVMDENKKVDIPLATASSVGVVKVDNDTILVDENGTISAEIAEYSMEKLTTPQTDYLATYQLTKDGVKVGDYINIPKDFLVKSGSVKTCEEDDKPVAGYKVGDKYIDFVINTKDGSGTDEHLYILVKDLVDNYTSGNGLALMNNKFSVNLTIDGGLQFDGSTEDSKTLGIDDTIVVTLTGAQTLTNKTIDADNNTISNLEVDNFKTGVVKTEVRPSTSAQDITLVTEKAVATLGDTKVDVDQTTAKAGKVAIVGDDGMVTFTDTLDGGTF